VSGRVKDNYKTQLSGCNGAAKAVQPLICLSQEHPQIYIVLLRKPTFFALEGEQLLFQGGRSDYINKFSITKLELWHLIPVVANEIAIEASHIPTYSLELLNAYIPDVR